MLTLRRQDRLALWAQLIDRIEDYFETVDQGRVSQPSDPAELRAMLEPLDFDVAVAPEDAVAFVIDGLWRHQVHTSHARYYGLFNPNPTTMGIAADLSVTEPHRTTMQWSCRFIGLKLFLSLMVAGWKGYEDALRHQTDRGNLLREKLVANEWCIANDTPLPTICWDDARNGADNSLDRLLKIARFLNDSGKAWISTTRIGGLKPVLRATMTNYRTQPRDLDALVNDIEEARRAAGR